MNLYLCTFPTPAGSMLAVVDETGGLVRLDFAGEPRARQIERQLEASGDETAWDEPRCRHVVAQLDEYFRGERRDFELQLRPRGTSFQLRVWDELLRIPYGETRSYGQLAESLGHSGAARAVGRANGTNPIAIVVPCHRVIGADGTLTGYGGGLDIKRLLLRLEGSAAAGGDQLAMEMSSMSNTSMPAGAPGRPR